MAEEKRLIDAKDFIKNFWQRVHDGEIVTLMDVEHAIINAPTVDAVEVVRCKDCTHYTTISGLDKYRSCDIFCGCYGGGYPTEPDDFCSYGERKTEK